QVKLVRVPFGQVSQRGPVAQSRVVLIAQLGRQRLRVNRSQRRQALVALGANVSEEGGKSVSVICRMRRVGAGRMRVAATEYRLIEVVGDTSAMPRRSWRKAR